MKQTPIAASWEIFSKLDAFKDCPPEDLKQFREVFYGGAIMLFNAVVDHIVDAEPEDEEAFLNAVIQEAEAFAAEMETQIGEVH